MKTNAFASFKAARKTVVHRRSRKPVAIVAQAGFCEIYERITGTPPPAALCPKPASKSNSIASFLTETLKQAPVLEAEGPTILPPANLSPPTPPPEEEDLVTRAVEDYFAVESGLETVKEAEPAVIAGLEDAGISEAVIETVAPDFATETASLPVEEVAAIEELTAEAAPAAAETAPAALEAVDEPATSSESDAPVESATEAAEPTEQVSGDIAAAADDTPVLDAVIELIEEPAAQDAPLDVSPVIDVAAPEGDSIDAAPLSEVADAVPVQVVDSADVVPVQVVDSADEAQVEERVISEL